MFLLFSDFVLLCFSALRVQSLWFTQQGGCAEYHSAIHRADHDKIHSNWFPRGSSQGRIVNPQSVGIAPSQRIELHCQAAWGSPTWYWHDCESESSSLKRERRSGQNYASNTISVCGLYLVPPRTWGDLWIHIRRFKKCPDRNHEIRLTVRGCRPTFLIQWEKAHSDPDPVAGAKWCCSRASRDHNSSGTLICSAAGMRAWETVFV